MERVFIWLVAVVFSLATVFLALYSAHLLALVYLFRRRAAVEAGRHKEVLDRFHAQCPAPAWPKVTSQIPIYNEAEVAERVIDAVCRIDYPAALHEVQVLDDSTDLTRDRVDRTVARWQEQGVNVRAIRRPSRKGYKAGALANGLDSASGEYVAVFDADFVPEGDFLRRALPPLVMDAGLACYQGRWSHLNREESWLTRAQAMGLDTHFAIEQGARAWNGLMMNFNGTAGVWRRSAIDDPRVGGWHHDTLTEDMDLSYRAQLAGWRIDYCVGLACPSELPGTMLALKSQQRRWATGSIQVARKLLPTIWRARIPLAAKLEATFHLTNHSTSVWMLILATLAKPMVLMMTDGIAYPWWAQTAIALVLAAALAPPFTYAYARYTLEGRWAGCGTLPAMFVLGSGLCLSNTLGVLRGLWLKGGEFVRTPKSGSSAARAKRSTYNAVQGHLWLAELGLAVYSLMSFVFCVQTSHYLLSFFLLIYAVGFAVVGWMSRPPITPPAPPRMASIREMLGSNVPTVEPAGGR